MRAFTLSIQGDEALTVTVETPRWFPFQPKIKKCWLRSTFAEALRRYLEHRAVVWN